MVKTRNLIIIIFVALIIIAISFFIIKQAIFTTTRVCDGTCFNFLLTGTECSPCNTGETPSNIRVNEAGTSSANYFNSVSAYCGQVFLPSDAYSKFATCTEDTGGGNEQCTNSNYPDYCVATDGCLSPEQDCNERCCIGGGCDDWDDWWYCNDGNIASCNVQSPWQNNMVCCPNDFPVWNEQTQTCWKSNWECTDNSQCLVSGEVCINNLCEQQQQGCVENWECSDWSDCRNSQQIRTCVDNNACGTTSFKPDTQQTCTSQEYCGDGVCNGLETSNDCPEDCGTIPECTTNSDCPINMECVNGDCELISTPECNLDSDCNTGYECVNQVCKVIPPEEEEPDYTPIITLIAGIIFGLLFIITLIVIIVRLRR
jgi:hypothetical protein